MTAFGQRHGVPDDLVDVRHSRSERAKAMRAVRVGRGMFAEPAPSVTIHR